MIICGIDPGLSGAIAWLRDDGYVTELIDMPVLKTRRNGKGEVDADVLADYLEHYLPNHIFVEKVGPFHRAGAASSFTFGDGSGVIRGVVAALKIPRTPVKAQEWKKLLRVKAAKDSSLARASELMPSAAHYWRDGEDGRAEAALIAYYGLTQMRMEHVLASPNNTRACLEGNDNSF